MFPGNKMAAAHVLTFRTESYNTSSAFSAPGRTELIRAQMDDLGYQMLGLREATRSQNASTDSQGIIRVRRPDYGNPRHIEL